MRMHTFAHRIVGLVFGLALALSFAACGGGEVEKSSGGGGGSVTQESLVATWGSGSDTLTLGADGRYSWTETRGCKSPPCPQKTTSGRWEDRRGQLYLDPTDGDDRVLSYTLSPGKLSLSGDGKTYSYVKR